MRHGYVKLSRKLFDGGDPFWDERRTFSRFEAWVDLIQRAAWHGVPYSSQRGVDQLHRGEFVGSLRYFSRRWKWGKNVVDRYFKLCEKRGQIMGQRDGRHGRIYLIVNYDHYQSSSAGDGTLGGTVNGTAAGQSRDKDESSKAVKTSLLPTAREKRAPRTARSRNGSRRPAQAVAGATPAPPASNWVTRFADEFAAHRGGIAPYSKIGKQLKALIDRDGEAALWPAWQRFCAGDKAQYGAAWFAENTRDFVTPGGGAPLEPHDVRIGPDGIRVFGETFLEAEARETAAELAARSSDQ